MKYLQKLGFKDVSEVLWLDIETATIEKELTQESLYWDAWEQKVRWDEKVVTDEDIKERYKERAPIYKEFSKIVSISYGRVKDGVLKVKNVVGQEKDIIEQLFKDVEMFNAGGVKFLGVFSGKQFDVPFISFRAIVNQIPVINAFDIGGLAPWNIKHIIDVQDILKGTSSTGLSLQGVCASLGLKSPKLGEVNGASVNEMYWQGGNIVKISVYNNEDVLATCNAFCKYLMIPTVEMEVVGGKVEVEKLPLLKQIWAQKRITEENKKELLELLKAKKLLKKDREKVLTLISACLADIDANFGKVKNETDINNIINQLREEI